MKYTAFNEYRVSQLALGTIQLGMDYGIANPMGAPDREEAFTILNFARQSGITAFDTARTYGRSEELLGDYFSEKPLKKELIITKFKYDWFSGITFEQAWDRSLESITASLEQLRLSSLPLVLYHKGANEPMEEMRRFVPRIIRRLREAGLIERGGISLYYSREARELDPNDDFEAVQIPLNIFDNAVIADGTLKKLSDAGILVFVRSVFLQGLFFRDPDQLTGVLATAAPFLKKAVQLSNRFGLTIPELCFGFIRDLPEVHSLVIGAEKQQQIESNLQLLSGPTLPKELIETLVEDAKSIPREVIIPGLWTS